MENKTEQKAGDEIDKLFGGRKKISPEVNRAKVRVAQMLAGKVE
ncbi:MAG: hypothetical protein U5K54_14605 [Cytophagales bacterium]|nr:hypothetical protein [Cytophagales bacterium]